MEQASELDTERSENYGEGNYGDEEEQGIKVESALKLFPMLERNVYFSHFQTWGRQTPQDIHYFFKSLIGHFKGSQLSFLKT